MKCRVYLNKFDIFHCICARLRRFFYAMENMHRLCLWFRNNIMEYLTDNVFSYRIFIENKYWIVYLFEDIDKWESQWLLLRRLLFDFYYYFFFCAIEMQWICVKHIHDIWWNSIDIIVFEFIDAENWIETT